MTKNELIQTMVRTYGEMCRCQENYRIRRELVDNLEEIVCGFLNGDITITSETEESKDPERL